MWFFRFLELVLLWCNIVIIDFFLKICWIVVNEMLILVLGLIGINLLGCDGVNKLVFVVVGFGLNLICLGLNGRMWKCCFGDWLLMWNFVILDSVELWGVL